MSDLISRQAVLDKFKSLCDVCGEGEKYDGVMCRCCSLDDGICIVEDMPSAEPERKHGEWIKEKENDVLCHCSTCGYKVVSALSNLFYNFCPHCGADMRGNNEKA